MPTTELDLPSYDDVVSAARRLEGVAHRTPVLTSRRLNEEIGASVFLKAENLQRMGAFKFRGAFNALSQFSSAHRRAGVVTFSSGNHAQAIALAASILDIPATIVMPHDAPPSKVAATKGYGGEVIGYDRYTEDREEIGAALAQQRGLTLIPPYDHPHVIAGQGTAMKELIEEVGELDAILVCLGGGGLLAGSALAAHALSPSCAIYGVEPAAGNDGQLSLAQGSIVHIDTPQTIADGAQTQHLGTYNFAVIQERVTAVITVTDDELREQMRTLAATFKVIAEPTGVLGLAGIQKMSKELAGLRVGAIISGGNVDLDSFARLVAS